MEIVRAKEILKLRGFEIEDYSQVKYRVTDEELDDLYNTDEELIRFAKDQEQNLEEDL